MAGPYENAKPTPARDMGAIALSKTVNSIVGTTATLITRPTTSGPDGVLYLQADLGDWRIRAGDYVGFAFVDGDVTVGDDTIDETSHGYDTGDGPFQLVLTPPLFLHQLAKRSEVRRSPRFPAGQIGQRPYPHDGTVLYGRVRYGCPITY